MGRLISLSKRVRHLHHKIKLNRAARADIDWWVSSLRSHNGVAAFPAPWTFADTNHLYSDASDIAIGAVYNAAWFHLSFTGSYGYLADKSINYREMYAAVRALATWGSSLRNSRVTLHIDNQAVCGCINRGASQSADLMALVRSYVLLVSEYYLECRAFYIESQANESPRPPTLPCRAPGR